MGVLSLTSTGIKLGQPWGHLKASLTYCAYLDCERLRAVLRLPLHLLFSTILAQVYIENTCTYHGTWLYVSGRVMVALQFWVASVGDLSYTQTTQDPWDVGPVAYCFRESNVQMTALCMEVLISDFCMEFNSFELLCSTTASYHQLSFHSHPSILSVQSISFP